MTSTNQWIKKYLEKFEVTVETWSKELFKTLKLYHWSPTSKMIVTLFIVIGPVCFIIVGSIALLVIFIYNKVAQFFYDKKIKRLEAKERQLLQQLAEITGKKVN